ncbi:MAG: hypothetical protein GY754_25925 [bacterium]|nr:hypothetical protein [bacterium]
MNEILEKANELGLLIRETEACRDFEELSAELENDTESKSLLDEYTTIAESIHQRETQGGIVENFEKERVRELSGIIRENKLLTSFLEARGRYIDLLSNIQKSMGITGG